VNPDVLVLCHGGPIATPDDAAHILGKARNCHGFYGASSLERLPTETALTETTRTFKRIAIRSKEKPS
jgi:predicted TIM-barrel enzyme